MALRKNDKDVNRDFAQSCIQKILIDSIDRTAKEEDLFREGSEEINLWENYLDIYTKDYTKELFIVLRKNQYKREKINEIKLLNDLFDSIINTPIPHYILKVILNVSRRIKDNRYAFISLFFLRFICPRINICQSEYEVRVLVALSSVFQQMSQGKTFNMTNSKSRFNGFMESNKKRMDDFVDTTLKIRGSRVGKRESFVLNFSRFKSSGSLWKSKSVLGLTANDSDESFDSNLSSSSGSKGEIPDNFEDWKPEHLQIWFKLIDLPEYKEYFTDQDGTYLKICIDSDFSHIPDIQNNEGHKNRIIRAFNSWPDYEFTHRSRSAPLLKESVNVIFNKRGKDRIEVFPKTN